MSGWDYGCDNYFNTYEEYDNEIIEPSQQPSVTPVSSIVAHNKPSDSVDQEAQNQQQIDLDTFDEMLNEPGQKRFVDQNGNPLDIEDVRRIIAEEGGGIHKIEERVVE